MNNYIRPNCVCGGELLSIETHYFELTKKINKDGTLTKKIKRWREHDLAGTISNILKCTNCEKVYDFDLDEKDRVINIIEVDIFNSNNHT